MDTSTLHVVYVDRRAKRDRQHREKARRPPKVNVSEDPEHQDVLHNVETLLSVFAVVSVCNSAPSCISLLSEIDPNELQPTLVLLDVPLQRQPEESSAGYEGRHDSGIATEPADLLYGLPLLRFINIEMENSRMSKLVVPVAFLTSSTGEDGPIVVPDSLFGWSATNEPIEARELQCLDNGASDCLRSPITPDRVRGLRLQCHKAKTNVEKARRHSWVGLGDHQPKEPYSYLREKMVSELMMDICKPKKAYSAPHSSRYRIPSARVAEIRKSVGSWSFSAHAFTDEELVCCAQLMFEHAYLIPELSEYTLTSEKLTDFIQACRSAYNPMIPYHNFRHVIDVLQAVFFFLLQLKALPQFTEGDEHEPPQFAKSLSHLLTPTDALTLLVCAIGHDVGHPGVNNAFLVTLKAPLAQVYNDRSVLESFHCAAFSQILRKYWPKTMEMRKMMIDMILATDMGLHFDYMGKLDKLIKKKEKDGDTKKWDAKQTTEYRNLLCSCLIKCADISNVARKHQTSAQWAEILIEEFARQARMESDLGIPSSLVAPPVTGSVLATAKSQVGFMGLFAIPLFEHLSRVLPEMNFSVEELAANKAAWQNQIELNTHYANEILNKMVGTRSPTSRPAPRDTMPSVRKSNSPELHVEPEPAANDRSHLPPVLGTVLMESELPDGDRSQSTSGVGSGGNSALRSRAISPFPDSRRSSVAVQHSQSGDGNATAVTVVVTQPKPEDAEKEHKTPSYNRSTEHLRADTPDQTPYERPRSSPPDLGDRRSSRFFRKVRLWKQWRREGPVEG